MTTGSKLPTVLLLMLTGIVLLLMVAIIGLSVRMNQLQAAVPAAQPVIRVSGAVTIQPGLVWISIGHGLTRIQRTDTDFSGLIRADPSHPWLSVC
jgi:hypothetical protein